MNLPQVQQIDVTDPRFFGMHIGNGEGMIVSEKTRSAWRWTKMILALYKNPMEARALKEPNSCLAPFKEARISLEVPSYPCNELELEEEKGGDEEAIKLTSTSTSSSSPSPSSSSSPSSRRTKSQRRINVNADGEVVAFTDNVYVKVHRRLVDFHGTGRVEGHLKVDGRASLCQYRCFMFSILTFVLIVVVSTIVGMGFLIQYFTTL